MKRRIISIVLPTLFILTVVSAFVWNIHLPAKHAHADVYSDCDQHHSDGLNFHANNPADEQTIINKLQGGPQSLADVITFDAWPCMTYLYGDTFNAGGLYSIKVNQNVLPHAGNEPASNLNSTENQAFSNDLAQIDSGYSYAYDIYRDGYDNGHPYIYWVIVNFSSCTLHTEAHWQNYDGSDQVIQDFTQDCVDDLNNYNEGVAINGNIFDGFGRDNYYSVNWVTLQMQATEFDCNGAYYNNNFYHSCAPKSDFDVALTSDHSQPSNLYEDPN